MEYQRGFCPRIGRTAIAVAAACILALCGGRAEASRVFDIDIDDRTDPVRPGEHAVYELNVENSLTTPAPDVVVTDFLPPGTSFVAAYRAPDFSAIPTDVVGGQAHLHLGQLDSCGNLGLPPCRDVWITLKVDQSVAPGTVLTNHVVMSSSDPVTFPDHQDTTYTSVGTAAIRKAKVALPVTPGRDRVYAEADLARDGMSTPSDPPPPTLNPADGLRVILREPGGATALDVTVDGDSLRCHGTATVGCKLGSPSDWKPLGLDRLTLSLPHTSSQRNNAHVLVRTSALSLPDDFGPVLELTIVSGGVTYTDVAELIPHVNRLTYAHKQSVP